MNTATFYPVTGSNENFTIEFREREAFNTHWVFTPTIRRRDGTVLVAIEDTNWSLDTAAWSGDRLAMTMRKYPGNHVPADIVVTIDCAAGTGEVANTTVPLAQLERAMDAALHWLTEDEQRALQAARRPPPRKPWWKFW